jgi:hypothetical protein
VIVEGVVDDFDERRGDGHVRSEVGDRFYFHCVNIADGSRRIEVGTRVRAQRHGGLLGRDEVTAVEKRT